MKLIATLAILAVAGGAQTSRSGRHTVTAIRHWSQPEATRIAIEVSGRFEYRSDHLHNPERVYFDILDARPRIDSRRFYSAEYKDKLVTKVRVAETQPGITRVVLDLTGAVDVKPSQLSNPDRLIIELRAAAPAAIPTLPPVVSPPPARTPAPVTAPPIDMPLKPPPARTGPPVTTATATTEAAKPAPAKIDALKTEAAKSAAVKTETPKPDPLPVETPKAARHAVSASAAAKTETPKPDVLPAETAKAAHHTASGGTSLIRALGLKVGRVVIDPGHGGHDQGTEGPHGLLEKDLVLDVAKRVGALIEERLGAEVIYTRSDDTFIPLEARTAIANDNKADLFLSIHANSSPVPRIVGVETYYRSFTNAKDSLEVAARENASSQKSIAELEDVIHTMMLGDKVEESKDFASRIQASLQAFSARTFPGVRDRGVKKAPFVVLAGAKAPSVLVEIGFLSNGREESLLRRSDYRQRLAEALYRGVAKYAESLSHFQVAKAANNE